MARTAVIGLFLCCAGCFPSFLRDPSLATYEDIVSIMNLPQVPDRTLPGGMTRADLQRKLQQALADKQVAAVRRMLEKEGYDCQVIRPQSTCLRDMVAGSRTRGVLSCVRQLHAPENKVVHLDRDDQNIHSSTAELVKGLQKEVEGLVKELISQETIFVRYENGKVIQVAVL